MDNPRCKSAKISVKMLNAAIQSENPTQSSTLPENDEDSNYFTISSEMSI